MFPLCCFGFSVVSDDPSEAREVRATPETDRHQQITAFVYISINGHSEEGRGHTGKCSGVRRVRERVREITELLCRFAVRCFMKTQKVSAGIRRAAGQHDKIQQQLQANRPASRSDHRMWGRGFHLHQ